MKILSSSIILALVMMTPSYVTANTNSSVIQNSISVSASSGQGGENTIKVKTVHNGEVVEDTTISSTTPIHYESNHQSNDTTINTATKATEIEPVVTPTHYNTRHLTLLLDNLLTLLSYYEKLLQKQNQ